MGNNRRHQAITGTVFAVLAMAGAAQAQTTAEPNTYVTASVPASAAIASEPRHALAPADEYFGPLQMSVLEMRNALRDAAARLDQGSDPADALKSASIVEASLREWEAKYPRDNWLPRTLLALQRVYDKISIGEASSHAIDVMSWLILKYPGSEEAKTLRDQLVRAMGHPTAALATATGY